MRVVEGLRFCVVNLGCKVNRVESDTIAARLMSRGCLLVPEAEAELIVVNTCTVTGEADKKTRKAVRHALRAPAVAEVVVTGCAVAIQPAFYESLDPRVRVMQRAEIFAELTDAGVEEPLRMGGQFRTRVNVKVQDGCDRACTYCIVHVARGKAHSMPADQVLAHVRPYLENGVKEIVLTGIDLGSYHDGGMRLADLTGSLIELADSAGAPGLPARVRASSLEPVSVDEAFVDLLARSEGRLCRHVHLPLQAGSAKVLREMARPYSPDDFLRLVETLRSRVEGISITTDIICGFPGETDEEFEETMRLARACRFSKIHVFPYSMRTGTPAAERDDQIAPEVKEERAARLRALSDELRAEDLAARCGTVELALVEGETLLTESYHELPACGDYRQGSLVPFTIG